MNPASLSFSNVRCRRGDFVMEADTSFPAGKLTVILGPSGCGKTTLLDLAAGFIQPDMGEIREGERNVTSLPPEKRNIGVVFQDNALFPHMSVHRNIIFGPLSRGAFPAGSRRDRPAAHRDGPAGRVFRQTTLLAFRR